MSQEEDFACDKFAPQKWRKDVCRNCYQPARLHEKRLARQGTLSTKPPPQTSPIVKASTLPPRIKPPTAPKSSLLLKTPPDPTPPIASMKAGGVISGVPAKPAPPPVAKAAIIARPPPPTKPEPKVFQRFLVKKEPLIDRNVPPKERTKQPELEGIQPGIVKNVHEVAPTLKTDVPPQVQAILDQNTKSVSVKATDSKTVESASQPPQESSQNETAAMESGPSPPPPVVPPRPAGYELTDEISPTNSTLKEPPSTAVPSTTSQPQEEERKVSINEQPSLPKAVSEAVAEVQATTQPSPVSIDKEEEILPTAASNQEDEAKEESKMDNLEKKEMSEEEEQQFPEQASEAKAEPQPGIDTPSVAAAAPVCTDKVCLLPKRAQEQGSTGEESDQKTEDETQVPPEPDFENTTKDDTTETVGEEKKQGDNDVQLPETVMEGERAKEEPVASGDQETPTQTADVKDDTFPEQDIEIDRELSEAKLEKPIIPEIQEEKQEEGDLSEPKDTAESAVPASEAELSETLQTKDEQAEQMQVNAGGEMPVIDETITAAPVAMLESECEGTDGGTDAAALKPEQTSEADQQQTVEEAAQEETPVNNEAIKDSNHSTEGEEKQQLDEAPVSVEQEGSNGIISDENQATTETAMETGSKALMMEEENSQSNAAAIDEISEAEIPEEEEVKSKIPPPPPPPTAAAAAQEEIERDEDREESASAGPPAPPPPPPIDGLPLAPPPPPPPPIGVQIPKGPPKAEEVKKKAQSVKSSGDAMAYEEAMAAIRGGVRLKSVPAPAERQAGEEKVVDVASELRQKLMKQKRKEVRRERERERAHVDL